jgi:transcriptional regulator with XRE-family HTH domain
MKPTYQVKAWKDDGWWLARVTEATDGADLSPLNAITQARSLAKIEEMARDLIATILDESEGQFEVRIDYNLPAGVGVLLDDAAGARAWLDAAQVLWQERAVAAARALTAAGFSLREVAQLLGLSHQRVDQLLASETADHSNRVAVVLETKCLSTGVDVGGSFAHRTKARPLVDADFVLIVTASSQDHGDWVASADRQQMARERLAKALMDCCGEPEDAADDIAVQQSDHEDRCRL